MLEVAESVDRFCERRAVSLEREPVSLCKATQAEQLAVSRPIHRS